MPKLTEESRKFNQFSRIDRSGSGSLFTSDAAMFRRAGLKKAEDRATPFFDLLISSRQVARHNGLPIDLRSIVHERQAKLFFHHASALHASTCLLSLNLGVFFSRKDKRKKDKTFLKPQPKFSALALKWFEHLLLYCYLLTFVLRLQTVSVVVGYIAGDMGVGR